MDQPNEESRDSDPDRSGATIASQALPLTVMLGVFFMTFLARLGLAPMMPVIEADLGIGHAQAGSFFLLMSLGFATGMFLSGFVSSRITHKWTIAVSGLACGLALLLLAAAPNLWLLRISLIIAGMTAGLYLPSGVATITASIRRADWGKALAIQQMAPNLGYVAAPFLAEVMLAALTWRQAVTLYGLACLACALIYMPLGRMGRFPGAAPRLGALGFLARDRTFWILTALFSVAIGVNQGSFAMIPLYLTAGRGLDPTLANTLIAISRAAGLATPLLAGWLADRFGLKLTMGLVALLSGTATMWLGLTASDFIAAPLILQAMIGVCFFPLGFAALSVITTAETRNLSVSLAVPISHFLGGGLVPGGIGLLGQEGSFEMGLILLGGLTLAGLFLIVRMDLHQPWS